MSKKTTASCWWLRSARAISKLEHLEQPPVVGQAGQRIGDDELAQLRFGD